MSRDWTLRVDDIWQAASKVRRYTAGMTREMLAADERTYDAVIRNLEIIGEAANHLPQPVRDQMPSIEWPLIVGMRNVLSHVYFGVSEKIVWDVITLNVPELLEAITEFRNRPAS